MAASGFGYRGELRAVLDAQPAEAGAVCFGKNHKYPSEPISFQAENEDEKGIQDAQRFEVLAINFNQQHKEDIPLNG